MRYWTSKDGRKTAIKDMTTPHLYNAIAYCLRKHQAAVRDWELTRELVAASARAEEQKNMPQVPEPVRYLQAEAASRLMKVLGFSSMAELTHYLASEAPGKSSLLETSANSHFQSEGVAAYRKVWDDYQRRVAAMAESAAPHVPPNVTVEVVEDEIIVSVRPISYEKTLCEVWDHAEVLRFWKQSPLEHSYRRKALKERLESAISAQLAKDRGSKSSGKGPVSPPSAPPGSIWRKAD